MKITCDATELLSLVERLNVALELRERVVDPPKGAAELVAFDVDYSAALAGELVVRLNPSDGLRRFGAAVGALNVNGLIVEDAIHESVPYVDGKPFTAAPLASQTLSASSHTTPPRR